MPDPSHNLQQPGERNLEGKRVLVGISGGIACYKVATLVSRLVQRGADVRVVMTDAATRFVAPLTFQSLSGHPVLTSIWESDDRPDSQHVGLARWCEMFIIAPATADCIARVTHGLTGDLVTLTANALPGQTPLLIAPAMNADMWAHPATQRNVRLLTELLPNLHMTGPDAGWQACRTLGAGRMSEPEAILERAAALLLAPRA